MFVLGSMRSLVIMGIVIAMVPMSVARSATTMHPVAHVAIRDLAFTPQVLHVRSGTTVVWTNFDDVAHTVTSGTTTDTGVWKSSPPIPPGKTFTHTFTMPGRYPYYCKPHFYDSAMHAVIVVER